MPTSSGRSKGAGLLKEKERVEQLLEIVLPRIRSKLSIKTRIGFEDENDLIEMSEVFNKFPIEEVMIHPRTAEQKYTGQVNHERFSEACSYLKQSIVFSGDINSREDILEFKKSSPSNSSLDDRTRDLKESIFNARNTWKLFREYRTDSKILH